MNYSRQDLIDIIEALPEPAQLAVLIRLDLGSLCLLIQSGPILSNTIRNPYTLEQLAMEHDLPIPYHWDHFLGLALMSMASLINYGSEKGIERVVKAAISKNPDLDRDRALRLAIVKGHNEIASYFMDLGTELLPDQILFTASCAGNLEMIKILVERVTRRELRLVWNAAETAISCGHTSVVLYLIELDDLNISSLIYTAVEHGNLELVQILIDKGASCDDDSLAISACEGHLEILKILIPLYPQNELEAGISVVFHHAAVRDRLNIVQYLVENYPDYIRSDSLASTLSEVAQEGHTEVVKYLNKAYPQIDTKDALMSAARFGHLDIVRYLIDLWENPVYDILFYCATERPNINVVKFLMEGLPRISTDLVNSVMCMVPANLHSEKTILYLIGLGFELNQNSLDKALISFSLVGNKEAARDMIDRGANPSE